MQNSSVLATLLALVTTQFDDGFNGGFEELVEELQHGTGARTCIIYDFSKGSQAMQQLLWTNEVPRIVVGATVTHEFRHQFNSEVLSIVYISSHFEEDTMGTLKTTLNRWHKTDLLFVATEVAICSSWRWLFDWCWSNGFFNVLLVNPQQQPKHMMQLCIYEPFSYLHIELIATLKDYFKRRNNFLNMRGYPIRAAIGNNPPRAIIYKNPRTNELVYSGYYYNLLQAFTKHYNATLHIVLMPNYTAYSILDCFEHVKKRWVDICADGGIFGASFLTTYPISLTNCYLMVPFARPLENFRYFLLPFHLWVWIAVLMTTCFIAMVISCFYWRTNGHWNISASLILALRVILFISFDLSVMQRKGGVLVQLILTIAGFMLTNLYLALLSSFLSTNVYDHQIDTFTDLIASNVTILANEYDVSVFKATNVPAKVWEHLQLVDQNTHHLHRNNLDPHFAYSCAWDKCEFYMYQQSFLSAPRQKIMSKSIFSIYGGVPIVFDWPFEELLNQFVLSITCAGINLVFYQRSKDVGIANGVLHFFVDESNNVKPLSMDYFQMPLILFAVGYSAAVLAFVIENLFFYLAFSRRRTSRLP